jgi:hypothetical protein
MANNETPAPTGSTYEIWADGAVLLTHVDTFGKTTEFWMPAEMARALALDVVTKSLKS